MQLAADPGTPAISLALGSVDIVESSILTRLQRHVALSMDSQNNYSGDR